MSNRDKLFMFIISSLLLATAAAFVGCGEDNLPKVSYVDSLRILALKTSPVTVPAGANNVTITALVADPKGGGRSVTYHWEVCLLAQADSTFTRCLSTLTTSDETTTSATPSLVYTNNLSSAAPLLITLTATAGSESRSAVRNLSVVESTTASTPAPVISELKINGSGGTSAISLPSGRSYPLELVLTSGYTTNSFVTWVSDAGSFDASRTLTSLTNQYGPVNVPGTYNVYSVFNDGSGGVDFVRRQVIVP